jgi:flavin-dependent dehydrogenase
LSAACDALIIGGGPAGATTALLLARAGWSVLVLERKAFPRRKVCGEYLSATNMPLLNLLGIGEAFRVQAGPPVTTVGLFARDLCLTAALPLPSGNAGAWGRALGREHLDTLLLASAVRAGALVWQPCQARTLAQDGDQYRSTAEDATTKATQEITCPVVIAAHGSWDLGTLPTQSRKQARRPADLLGFKAHFDNNDLPAGLMPLLVFPGGYGGMVHSDAGRVSLSCCIRRDRLELLQQGEGEAAGDAVLGYITDSCLGVRQALAGARLQGRWLATGPIRPGIRVRPQHGLFLVGNAAGEAHPVVAEGISMALQAGWLLAKRLIAWRRDGGRSATLHAVGADYAKAWRASFAPRLAASSVLAHWAMRPAAVATVVPFLTRFPSLLTLAARLTGKATRVVRC